MSRISKIAVCTSPLVLLILAGCSSITTKDPVVAADPSPSAPTSSSLATNPDPTPIASYVAYGDSITAGYLLTDPATQAYPTLVGTYEGVPWVNRGLVGEMACDLSPKQIFQNGDSPSLSSHVASSVLIGTNDERVKGVGTYEAVFTLCHQAALSWLAVPIEYKVLATGSGIQTTGPGSLDTSYSWNSWTTAGQGATVSFTIVTTQEGPIYAWPLISDTNPATYSYSLDGSQVETASTQTNPLIATAEGITQSLGFIRFPPVAAGKHVVTFTQTSSGANGVSVVGIGAPGGPSTNTLPTVLVGTIPYQYPGPSGGPCTQENDQPCEEYIQDIEADVTLLSGDGLDIRLFDTRKFMFGTVAEMSDSLHPNVLGQMELSQAVESVWMTTQ